MIINKFKTSVFPIGAGLMGALSLIGLYLSVLSVARSPSEALKLFGQNKLMLLPIAFGFALQVGMYVLLRKGLHRPLAIPGGRTTTTASGGTSGTAILACCAPALVNALPLLGFTAVTTFLARWQMPFIAASLLANAVGITVMGTTLLKAHRRPNTYLVEDKMNSISVVNSSFKQGVDEDATALARSRYDRIARIYDLMPMQFIVGQISRPWREKMWQMVGSSQVIEVGVGTGINIELWPADAQITAIDLSPRMLKQARKRAKLLGRQADLRLGDVQCLDFPDASFDVVIATFLFCSVPDPVLGLHEVGRVVRPGGKILLLEHMLSPNPFLGSIMNAINPVIVRMMGANINRRTLDNIRTAGLHIESMEDLENSGIFKLIVARRK